MNDVRSKLILLRGQAAHVPRTLRLVWQATGPRMLAWVLLLVVQGTLPVAIVYATRQVIDSLVGVAKDGVVDGGDMDGGVAGQDFVLPVIVLAILLVGEQVLRSAGQWVRTIQSERVQDHVTGLLQDKAIEADLSFYDSPAYFDRLHRARVDARSRPVALLDGLGSLGQNGLTLLGMAALLAAYSPWIPLLLVLGTLPALWVAIRYAERFNAWRLRNTVEERRCHYFDWLLTMREAAPELRLFALGVHYRDAYRRLRTRLRDEKIALERGQLATELGAGVLGLTTTALAMLWMVLRTAPGRASFGDLVLFYQAFTQGQRLLATLLRNAGEIYRNVLFLENLFEVLNVEPRVKDPVLPVPVPSVERAVRFEDVRFRYPEGNRPILDGFNLVLKAGETAALLGENGEGKTTILKLLCRLYDPDEGRITVDGVDLRDMRQADWRRQVTVLFQEPVHYHVTAAENIAHGNLAAAPGAEEIERVARSSGAHEVIARLPEGYATVLGRWFGGAELSTGEWQRVASARAFLRRSRLIILDEPTSMLDAWAEAQWFARFREFAVGCTALIISHRLSTTLRADVIHVMQDGRIIESGSHAELLEQGGRYRDAWDGRKHDKAVHATADGRDGPGPAGPTSSGGEAP